MFLLTMLLRGLLAAVLLAPLVQVAQYSSEALSRSQTAMASATLLNQGNQIMAASLLYAEEKAGAWPAAVSALTPTYLETLPLPPVAAYSSGRPPTASDWSYASASRPGLQLEERLNRATCQHINRKQGFVGIAATPQSRLLVQGYGEQAPFTLLFQFQPQAGQAVEEGLGYPVSCPDGRVIMAGLCPVSEEADTEAKDFPGKPFVRFFDKTT